jgi:hypothetical protein
MLPLPKIDVPAATVTPPPIKINNSARPPNHRSVVDARGRVWIYACCAPTTGLSSGEAACDLLKSCAIRSALIKAIRFKE